MELKLIEIERNNSIYKYSQLEGLTDEEACVALSRGFLTHILDGVKNKNPEYRYALNIDKTTNKLVLCDRMHYTIILRGVNDIRDFMIKNDLGVTVDIISLEKEE